MEAQGLFKDHVANERWSPREPTKQFGAQKRLCRGSAAFMALAELGAWPEARLVSPGHQRLKSMYYDRPHQLQGWHSILPSMSHVKGNVKARGWGKALLKHFCLEVLILDSPVGSLDTRKNSSDKEVPEKDIYYASL